MPKPNLLTLTLACAVLLSLIGSSPAWAKKPPKKTASKPVVLTITDPGGNAPQLVIETKKGANGCTAANSGKGCIKVAKGNAADILFKFKNKYECAADQPWELTAVQLGGYNSSLKPTVWGSLPADVQADFHTGTGGYVDFTVLNDKEIRVHNRNQAAYTIWYRLRATCGGKDIWADPRVRNTGR